MILISSDKSQTQEKMQNHLQLLVHFILILFSQSQNPKCQANNGGAEGAFRAILYKAPGQTRGKIIVSNNAGAWEDGAQVLTTRQGQSFGVTLQHVVENHNEIKFLAYNNVPPGMPNVKTKSNSKGVIIVQTTQNTDAASWIVHTVPGFPAAKTGYSWPVAENAKGHLLICLTISESQINAIAASLLRAEPLVHYNDIPETETVGMQYFKKLSDGQFPTVPPYLSRQSIKTAGQPAVTVNVYSKSASSRYEIYKRVIVKAFKKTIKVWSRRDNKLKGDCRVVERNIRLIKSPAPVSDHNTNLDADLTNWAVSDPGNIFCLIDRPYAKNQTVQSAMAVCIDQADIFARFNDIAAQVEDCPAILYKAPGQIRGKIIVSNSAGAWTDGNGDLTQQGGQSFGGTLEHVVQNHDQIKFLAYNNVPPGMPNVKTKSNSKGVIIVRTTPNTDAASWIVHTVPGFPAAKTGYSWPVAENAKGHILICLTISESQINAIAASLLRAEPLVHYNDIPETETVGMQYFKKLSDGQFPTVPPYLSRQSIKTAAQAAVTVNVYSKSASSRYEIYKRVIVKALKKSIKVWSRRDNKLKGDCRVVERNIRLIKSPARVDNHDTNLDADLTNWAVSDPGNIFCLIDKPYAKNQTVQSAMAVCIDQADIFARFNDIAAQVENCP
ncbi:Deoxyribonuclease-2-alpha [Trichinella murrelli]|uniref:Deoxyribonuclease-2-alpha n=1 Tax=Trichinella murrelli TaxID=144512 RepID=A0A0V0TBP7_9BILA|nr:Deoxyribonuclease-2-alpha [Trichinella murrelli]